MALLADETSFAAFLRLRGPDLTPEAIVEHVVRPGAALGPIALGEQAQAVLARLDPEKLPRGADGWPLRRLPEHFAQPGFAPGTEAHHLTVVDLTRDTLPGPPQGWLEWATDEATGLVVLVRYCVVFSPYTHDDHGAFLDGMRAAFERAHGPGAAHRKKHRRCRARSVTWSIGDGLLTLGTFDNWSFRYVVAELAPSNWAGSAYLRIECLQ